MSIQINALNVVKSVRDALKRVGGGETVTLTREEFESIAAVVEKEKAQAPRPSAPAKKNAQQALPLGPVESIKLPAGLDPDRFSKLLETPKTVAHLARETRVSKGSIKRALAAMPGVEVVRVKVRAHVPGRRAHVYAIH